MNDDSVSGKFDQIAGKIKQGVGEAVGNERLANSGAADQVKGNAKEAWGNVKDAAGATTDRAQADANIRAGETRDHAAASSHDAREKVTSTAQNVKNSLEEKVDAFRERHS